MHDPVVRSSSCFSDRTPSIQFWGFQMIKWKYATYQDEGFRKCWYALGTEVIRIEVSSEV